MSLSNILSSGSRLALRALTVSAAGFLLLGISPSIGRCDDQAAGAAKTGTPDQTEPKNVSSTGDNVIEPNQPIKADFVLRISITDEPTISGNYRVDQQGNITIAFAETITVISVKGLKPAEAADAITRELKEFIKNPHVSVSIAEVPHPVVYVGGEVRAAGPMMILPDTTLMDLLARIGWTGNADLAHVRLYRPENGGDTLVVHIYDCEKYLKTGNGDKIEAALNPTLEDKDRILLAPKDAPLLRYVAVLGAVARPQEKLLLRDTPPTTVREAINLAGGPSDLANRHVARIRRVGAAQPLLIDLDKAKTGDKDNDLVLQPDDTIYVEQADLNSYITFDGGFLRPGKIPFDQNYTLTQAVELVAGVVPGAKEKEGKIYRHPDNDPAHTQILAFNWNAIKNGKAQDIKLQPGDSISIPAPRGSNKMDILGTLQQLGSLLFLGRSL